MISRRTDGCPACTELSVGARAPVKAHNDECRERLAAEMLRDDDLAAGDRLRRHNEKERPQEADPAPEPGEESDMDKAAAQPAAPLRMAASAKQVPGPSRKRKVTLADNER